ncbi:3-isopropylmalate dehydrogenase [Candidatus Sulfopaludibacter sp. SbA3]|nr:3-isopropylmalate dehydrogenase [Candidatus Sulfopaludibacter sp. SbA3]
MSHYRVAWLQGDGIGEEVCDAARLVLDASGFQADYLPGDIGWEFWRAEGDALPPRTLDLLRRTDCAFFGAITSKPAGEAARELAPQFQAQGLTYRSPIVRMRQLLDLYVCLRPCRAFPGNPLNYRENIDLVIFRENTEGMYIGVEFPRIPEEMLAIPAMQTIPSDAAISIRSITPEASRRIVEAAFQFAVKHGRRKVTAVHKANVLRATCGVFLEAAREVAARYPQIQFAGRWRPAIRRSSSTPPTWMPCACGCSRTRSITTSSSRPTCSAISCRTSAPNWSAAWDSATAAISARNTPSSSPHTARLPNTPVRKKSTRSPPYSQPK